MVGRPLTKARNAAEAARVQQTTDLPTPRREQPVTFTDELLTEILELADCGLTDAEIASHWCLSETELHDMLRENPALQAAHGRAVTRSKARWLSWIRNAVAIGDTRFAAGAWSQYMRAIHPEFDDKASKLNVRIDITDRLVVVDLRSNPSDDVIEGEATEAASEPQAIGPTRGHARAPEATGPTIDRLQEGDHPLSVHPVVGLTASPTARNTPPGVDHPTVGRGGGGGKTRRDESPRPSLPRNYPPTPGSR